MSQLKEFTDNFYSLLQAQNDPLTLHKAQIKHVLAQLQSQFKEDFSKKNLSQLPMIAQTLRTKPESFQQLSQLASSIKSVQSNQNNQKEFQDLQEFCSTLHELLKKLEKPHKLLPNLSEQNIMDWKQQITKFQAGLQQNYGLEILNLINTITSIQKIETCYAGFSKIYEILQQIKNYYQNYVLDIQQGLNLTYMQQQPQEQQQQYQQEQQQVQQQQYEEQYEMVNNVQTVNQMIHENEFCFQLKCPLRPPALVPKAIGKQLIELDSSITDALKQKDIMILRIGHEQVFEYQRYLLSYQLKSRLFEIQLPPGLVIRLAELQPQKRYYYFFITSVKCDEPLNIQAKAEFGKQYLASLCTDHLDYLIPEYYGNFRPYCGIKIKNQLAKYEHMRNPLYYFKEIILEHLYKKDDLEIESDKVYDGFLKWIEFLSNTQLYDFSYPQKANQDYLKRKRSLQVNLSTINLTYKKIKQLQDVIVQMDEVIFKQQHYVQLIQLTKHINSIIYQFLRLETSQYQDLKEYVNAIRQQNLDEIIPKIINNYELSNYNQKINETTQVYMESQIFDIISMIDKNISNNFLKNKSLIKFYNFSPQRIVLQFFQQINLQHDLDLKNRIKTFDFFALRHFYFDHLYQVNVGTIFQNIIKDFNRSWFNELVWQQAFQSNYSIQSTSAFNNQFFVELLSIIFLKKNILQKQIFDSIQAVEENKENTDRIKFYLQNPTLAGDFGFQQHQTIIESALKHKKFMLVLQLLKLKEGKKIDPEYFNYLLEHGQKAVETSLCYSNQLMLQDTQYHTQIFDEINKLHPLLLSRLKWDHFWNMKLKANGQTKINILFRGYAATNSLQNIYYQPDDQFQLLFNTQIQTDLPSYLELHILQSSRFSKIQQVAKVGKEDQFSLLYLQPDYPLQKLMAYSLQRLLQLDYFQTRVELAEIEGQLFSVYEIKKPDVDGQNMTEFLQKESELSLTQKIGSQQLGYKVLLGLLLFSSEQSPEMEFLLQCQQQLVPVTTNTYYDCQHDAYLNAYGFKRQGDQLILQCTNIYFLTQFMLNQVGKEQLNKFQNIILILQQWMKQLTALQLPSYKNQQLIFPFHKESIIELTRRAHIIQKATVKDTYIGLLKKCDLMMGKYYEGLIKNKTMGLLDKFRSLYTVQVQDDLIKQDQLSYQESFIHTKYPGSFDFNHEFTLGPSKCLQMIRKYNRFLTITSVDEFKRKLAIIKKTSHLQVFLKYLDWSLFKDEEIVSNLQAFKHYTQNHNLPFNLFYITNCLYSKFFIEFRQFEIYRIKVLHLLRLPQLSDKDIVEISQQCTELHYLNISGCVSIYYISNNYKRLSFTCLKTLIADEMSNLKYIDIQCKSLTNLSVNDCPQLQYIHEYKCMKLKKIQLLNCLQLSKEIIQLWILQGKRIVLDEHTAQGSFKDFYMKQNIIYLKSDNESTNFSEKNFNILSDVYENCKSQPQNYVQILVKCGLLDESLQLNAVSLYTKGYDQLATKQILKSIFMCLLMNDEIKELDLQSLISKRDEDKRKLLDCILADFENIMETEIQKKDDIVFLQQLQIFADQIESISIPHSSEQTLQQVSLLIKIILKCRKLTQSLVVKFSNLRNIRDGAIKLFFDKLQDETKLNISVLDFSGNSLSIDNLGNIFKYNKGHIKIQQLILRNAGINDQMLSDIKEIFWKYQNLIFLDLSDNQITHKGLNEICQNQQEIENIMSTINLSNNKIGESNFRLSFNIKNLILQNIFTSQMNISGFCEYLVNARQLDRLDIRYNEFSEDQLKQIAISLNSNESITQFYFSNTSNIHCNQIFTHLQYSTKLNHLEFIFEQNIQLSNDLYNFILCTKLKSLELVFKIKINQKQLIQIQESIYNSRLNQFKIQIQDQDLSLITDSRIQLQIAKINHSMEKRQSTSSIRKSILETKYFIRQDTYKLDHNDYCRMGLSIDGGGVRGIIPGSMIQYLCTELKKEPYQIFDCIGGTSIGGIVALSLTGTNDGVTPLADKDEIVKIFVEHGKSIFDNSKRNFLNFLNKSKYDPSGIEGVLQKYFGATKLSQVLPNTNVIVTAVKLQKIQQDNSAKVFSSRLAKMDQAENFLMKDVGRATSAAPTYFPAAQIKSMVGKEYQFIDGGVGKNNPSNLVLEELRKGMINDVNDNFFLLSLSTGISKQKSQMCVDQGLLGVVQIINAFGTSNQDFVDLELQNYRGKYLRIVPEFNLHESLAQLDNTDPKILQEYQEVSIQAADKAFNEEKWGQFGDQSFLQWVAENTARKLESR